MFKEEFNDECILKHSQLEEIWKAFDDEMTRTIDKLIPANKQEREPNLKDHGTTLNY